MILPIATRELRTAARQRLTYVARCLIPLTAFALIIGFFDVVATTPAASTAGARAFLLVASLLFFFSLTPGLFLTADCLSSEKREGTLGLLFLTDLKGQDVVFGKLMATSTQTICGLIAVIPSLALPVLVGGVAGDELWRVPLVLINSIFLSLAVGMFWSAVCRDEHAALLAAAVTLFALTWIVSVLPGTAGLASPLTAFRGALGAGPATELLPFLASFALGQASGWAFLLLAGPLLQWAWRDTHVGKSRPALRARAIFQGRPGAGGRTRLLDGNPVGWLGGVGRLRPWIVLSLLITLSGLACVRGLQKPGANPPLAVITSLFISLGLVKFWIAWEASRRLYADRRSGALELLSVTSLSVDEIVDGQMLSLRRQFLSSIGFALVAGVVLIGLGLQAAANPTEAVRLLLDAAVMLVVFVVECWALGWQGLWRGLSARRSWSAPTATLLTALALPTLAWVGLIFLPGAASVGAITDLAVVWAIVAGVSALGVQIHARDRLRSEFRRYAAAPTAHPVSPPQEIPELEIPDYAFVGRPAPELATPGSTVFPPCGAA